MTRHRRLLMLAVAPLLLIGVRVHAGTSAALAGGTWRGVMKCTAFYAGTKERYGGDTLTVRITQNGTHLGIAVDYPDYGSGAWTDTYAAILTPDLAKPSSNGEVALVHCGTNDRLGEEGGPNDVFDEIGRMTIKVKPEQVKGSLKGFSIYSDPFIGSETEVGSCKWSFKRVDAAPPADPVSVTCPD
ncbi:MAG: hypothetical protein B6D46_14420 [Polyangiaceae bacterium UTPRO1]|jgi:hypothetical protein|nr:hypothetical protein [Myxococcales bacterium]OQY65302.1 MAG: hypothetical protein B6D46_14420 [Polyangiaceae bacterium UTPRO1]